MLEILHMASLAIIERKTKLLIILRGCAGLLRLCCSPEQGSYGPRQENRTLL